MQQALSALHSLLQDIYGLIDNLTKACSESKQTLQCINALCDGTRQSVAHVPDVQIFASNGTGTVNDSLVHQHINCICLSCRLPSNSAYKRLLTCKTEWTFLVMLQGPCVLSSCVLSPCLLSPSLLSPCQFFSSKLPLHLLLPVRLCQLPVSNSIVIAMIRPDHPRVRIRYGKCLHFMMCAMSCRMPSTHRSSG